MPDQTIVGYADLALSPLVDIMGEGSNAVRLLVVTSRSSVDAVLAEVLDRLGSAALLDAGAAPGNIPVLDSSGKLLTSTLPALAISDTFPVASQDAMLALPAERGDVAIRTDLNKTFVLRAEPATASANWSELLTPTDTVLAVAGLTGAITAPALRTALALAIGDVSGLQSTLDGKAAKASPVFSASLKVSNGSGQGDIRLQPGGGVGTVSGYIEGYRADGARTFYMGYANDAGVVTMQANSHYEFSGLSIPSSPVASLGPASVVGMLKHASNGRTFDGAGTLEASGAGTGCVVFANGTAWKLIGTNVTVSA